MFFLIMDLDLLSLSTLVQEVLFCVFDALRSRVYRRFHTYDRGFCWYCNLTSLKSNKENESPLGDYQTDTNEIYISTICYMLIATICITLNNWLISNIYLVQRVNNTIVFQNLQSSCICRLRLSLSFLGNTKKTHWNSVNEQNTGRTIAWEGVSNDKNKWYHSFLE